MVENNGVLQIFLLMLEDMILGTLLEIIGRAVSYFLTRVWNPRKSTHTTTMER